MPLIEQQVEQLLKIFSYLKDPILLIGDFNSPSSMVPPQARRLKDAHRKTGVGAGLASKAISPSYRLRTAASRSIDRFTQVRLRHSLPDHFLPSRGFFAPAIADGSHDTSGWLTEFTVIN